MITFAPQTDDAISATWVDLIDPTDDEKQKAAATTGLRVPTRADLQEVESSSRLYSEGGTIFLSTPAAYRGEGPLASVTPVGFVLGKDRLLTVRYAPLIAFDTAHARLAKAPADALGTLIVIVEALVDRLADVLETAGGELDGISSCVFGEDGAASRRANARNQVLRDSLQQIGRLGDRLSRIRDGLQGLSRIVPYVGEMRGEAATAVQRTRMETLKSDIASLRDYDQQLASKVSFLLDATLGFVGMQQNDIFRLLTIVSVVGIPPTLVAGIYGMNFKTMPEYDWAYGYQYGWAMLILSALVPIIWFRIKGWI